MCGQNHEDCSICLGRNQNALGELSPPPEVQTELWRVVWRPAATGQPARAGG